MNTVSGLNNTRFKVCESYGVKYTDIGHFLKQYLKSNNLSDIHYTSEEDSFKNMITLIKSKVDKKTYLGFINYMNNTYLRPDQLIYTRDVDNEEHIWSEYIIGLPNFRIFLFNDPEKKNIILCNDIDYLESLYDPLEWYREIRSNL